MRSSGEQELRNAFDRFSLWMLTRYVDTAATIKLVCCSAVQPHLRNYMLVLVEDRESGGTELTLLEHYLTKRQFEEVPQDARDEALTSIKSFLNVSPENALTHYVHITNECPKVDVLPPGVKLLKTSDMITPDRLSLPSRVLCVISAARELTDAHDRNVYETLLSSGKTVREELQQLATGDEAKEPPLDRSLFCVDAHPVNGIRLEDLATELGACTGTPAPLGLFLVRQAKLEHIKRYIRKHCVDRLEDVTADTSFLVSETVPFEAPFPEHASVHEVAHLEDYGIVFWQRSKGAATRIGKHFSISFRDQYDAVPPSPAWLNVLVSNETDGSTTYLNKLSALSRKTDPFRMVALLQGNDSRLLDVLRQRNASTMDKICTFFAARTDSERFAVARGELLLLVDHTMQQGDRAGLLANELVDFLNTIEKDNYRLTMWIVGDDSLWTRVVESCNHAAGKYEMPQLNEEERKSCLSLLLNEGTPDVETILKQVTESNSKKADFLLPGNIFFLAALADAINDNAVGQESGAPPQACWWIDVMERYVWKHIAPEGSEKLKHLEEVCYKRFMSDPEPSPTVLPHRTLVKLLAAKHLVEHPPWIDVEKYRLFGSDLINLLLFRRSPAAIAVLQHDIETVHSVQQNAPDTLAQETDCLQRNLLHVVNGSRELGELLVSAAVPMEQQCPQLNNWTPLQVADDREDWPLVDVLLANGAKAAGHGLKLHKMSLLQLRKVFSDCIAYNCKCLIEWILKHRPDYRISQEDVYCLAVYEEFDRELLFRLLAFAQDQRLPEREPEPYRYIWDNTALDSAVDDERYELAAFLVERLNFSPTEGFLTLQELHQRTDGTKFEDYKHLFSLCSSGALTEVSRLMEEKALDPFYEYQGSNIFISAAASDSLELVRHLYEKCAFAERLNDEDAHGCTAMSTAMQRGSAEIVRFLHDCGATVEPERVKFYSDKLPVDTALIDTEDFQCLGCLKVDRLQRLNIDFQRFEADDLLLHYYIFYADEPDEPTFRYLLAQYDDVDVRTGFVSDCRNGETPLHLALKSNNERCIAILLELGADVHAKSLRHGLTSLHYAIMGGVGRPILARLIEDYGIGVNTRDERGRSIAFYMPPDRGLYRWLIDRFGLDVTGCDKTGQTILHYRVIKDNFFARAEVEFLLQVLQFPQTTTDERGRLPLHYAVEAGSLATVRLLMKYRSDLLAVPDGDGMTAVQLAKTGHSTISEWLDAIAMNN